MATHNPSRSFSTFLFVPSPPLPPLSSSLLKQPLRQFPTLRTGGHSLLGYEAEPLSIFLSYGHDQYQEVAYALQKALEARGHKLWIDTMQVKKRRQVTQLFDYHGRRDVKGWDQKDKQRDWCSLGKGVAVLEKSSRREVYVNHPMYTHTCFLLYYYHHHHAAQEWL